MDAGFLHPWVWEAANSLWTDGHYPEAVHAAARRVNFETQNKVGRTDISEEDLFKQAFSTDAPKHGAPRLRLRDDETSKTYQSLQRGVIQFAAGCYAAIRNPLSQDNEIELNEHRALEQLAA
jgi:hypothetical protein